MEKRILPLTEPSITVYPIFSNPLSILLNYESASKWILDNFLQLYSNGRVINFYDFNYKLCPFFKIQRINKELIRDLKINVIEFIADRIINGEYAYLIVNSKYISAYHIDFDTRHDLFIYGVDRNMQVFYIADNFQNGKYSKEICTYKELELALKKLETEYEPYMGFKGCIEFIKFDENQNKKFSLKRIRDSLHDYMKGCPTGAWNVAEFRDAYEDVDFLFGIDCYKFLHERIDDLHNGVYIQDYHLIWEHKKHMKGVVDYLVQNEVVADNHFVQEWGSLIEESLICRNLAIKYHVSKKNKIKDNIHNFYKSMEKREREIIPALHQELSDYIRNVEVSE